MVYHFRRTRKLYEQRKKATTGCPFCDPAEIDHRIIEQTPFAYVIPNKTSYDVWEHGKVLEHLMILPKRHVASQDDLQDNELLDIARAIARYESAGYSVYSRAASNPNRSVAHQHTHLIKIDTKAPQLSLYMRRPYIMVTV